MISSAVQDGNHPCPPETPPPGAGIGEAGGETASKGEEGNITGGTTPAVRDWRQAYHDRNIEACTCKRGLPNGKFAYKKPGPVRRRLKDAKEELYSNPGPHRLGHRLPHEFKKRFGSPSCRLLTSQWRQNWRGRDHASVVASRSRKRHLSYLKLN